jgi:hypothetical protein
MIVSGLVRGMVSHPLASTPIERWSAARRWGQGSAPSYLSEHWFFFVAAVALTVLLLLLWWVSRRRTPARAGLTRELFAENALRRGLSSRERQILLAIVMRSGLGKSHNIFTTADAFDRGATKLLAECVRTRNPDEIENLKTEVSFLREKLGFQALRTPGALTQSRRPSSRDIPVGKTVEVTRRRRRDGATIRAEVVRNDDIELAVEMETSVEMHAGDYWRARYTFGMSVWEFDTTVVGCEGTRVVFNHVDNVRFVNRRRFPRVAVTMPVLVAPFPFMRCASAVQRVAGEEGLDPDMRPEPLEPPAFVSGVVTELAGPGLRVDAPLSVRAGDRVLVVFRLDGHDSAGPQSGRYGDQGCVVENVGQIRHCHNSGGGVSMAVELTGLHEADIDELIRMTNMISSRTSDLSGDGASNAPATVETAPAVQEV